MKLIQFSYYEKAGLILLVLLILANVLYYQWQLNKVKNTAFNGISSMYNVGESFESAKDSSNELAFEEHETIVNTHLIHSFTFDPNKLAEDSLILLGISKYASRNIVKYREKGGFFSQPEDLKKIYGLGNDVFARLQPLVFIRKENVVLPLKKEDYSPSFGRENVNKFTGKILINSADELAFKRLGGIGEILSKRIIKYRSTLGGFYRVDQIKEVYGIEDSLFSQIESNLVLDSIIVQKIKINEVTFKNLIRHPYADYEMTKSIINYRDMHGSVKDMHELGRIYSLDKEKTARLLPYLDFSQPGKQKESSLVNTDSLRLSDTISQSR